MGTLSPNLGLQVPTVGGDAGPLFAQEVNGALSTMDTCAGGINSLSVAGAANVTLTTSQAQNLIQQFTDALTGNITVLFPARNGSGGGASGFFAIENATTGNFSLSVGCVGGANTQAIPQGLSAWVWMDGTYTRISNPPGWQEITTYTISGAASQIILLPAPFRRFRLTLQAISTPTKGAILALQTSTNGGASFNAASTYEYTSFVFRADNTSLSSGSTANSSIVISGTLNAATIYDGTMEIYPGVVGVGNCRLRINHCELNSTPTWQMGFSAGVSPDTAVNAVQIFSSAGSTYSGTIIVEGLP